MSRFTFPLKAHQSGPASFVSILRGASWIAATAVLYAVSLPAMAGQLHASREPAFSVGAWTGMRYASPDGATVSCAVLTNTGGRDALAISIATAGGLTISAPRAEWKYPKGSVDVDVIIDGVTIATRAQGDGDSVVRVLFDAPDDEAVYDRLRKGRILRIDSKTAPQTYALTGLDQAMPALARCVLGQSRSSFAPDVPTGYNPRDPFDIPGASRIDRSEVMAVMANTMPKGDDDPKATFLLATELARTLPGYDVGWRDDTGVLVGTAVRGRLDTAGVDAIIGNLMGFDAARCNGKMRIEIDPPENAKGDTSTDIHTYCDGGGNGKEAHYLIYVFDNGGIMVTRFEPVSMKNPSELIREIYED